MSGVLVPKDGPRLAQVHPQAKAYIKAVVRRDMRMEQPSAFKKCSAAYTIDRCRDVV